MLLFSVPSWCQAMGWGLLSGSALLLGALVGYMARVPARLIGAIMAFGSGVLISALAFDLMEEAYRQGGFKAAATGFMGGALLYTGANFWINQRGARHRKRSGPHQPSESAAPGSGTAIALGALIDGIPESVAIGVSMLQGGAVSKAAVIAIFLSNLPEGLSSSAGMKKAGRSARYIFGVWTVIALLSGLAALAGFTLFRGSSPELIGATVGVAAGGILAMLSSTMIPEAFEEAHDFVGLITVFGFLCAFLLTKMEG